MDIILTVVLVFACIAMIALSALLIYDLSREFIEDQRAAKRREKLIKNWYKLDLTHSLYVDTDSIKEEVNHCYGSHQDWYKMRRSCVHSDKNLHAGRCIHPDNVGLFYCDYETCPILHEREAK